MALNDYTVALLRAIQSGQAYFTPGAPNAIMGIFGPVVDKNGTVGTGNLHFPGEEKFEKLGKFDPAGGFPLFRNTLSGRGVNSIYDPNSGFTSNQQLYGGQEGTLMSLKNISVDSSNRVVPPSNLINFDAVNQASQSTGVSPYLLAVSAAIQQGTAYLTNQSYDYKGNLVSGQLHFPGEENFQYQAGHRIANGSEGLSVSNDNYITGKLENIAGKGIVDSSKPLTSVPLSAGMGSGLEGLGTISFKSDSSGKIIPQNISDILDIHSSGGPTAFSNLAAAVFPTIANIALPGIGTAFSAINSIAQGADASDVLKNVAINQGISQGLGALTPTDTVDLNAATSGLQDVYGGNLPIEDITAAFDATGPLADTTITPDVIPTQTTLPPVLDVTPEQTAQIEASNTAMQQTPTAIDEAGQLAPTTPAENPYLAGMEETTSTEGAGVAGAENPTGTAVTTPEPVQEPVQQQASNLTPQQLYNLLKVGAGLFGGGGAIAAAAKGLMGGSAGVPAMGATMPTIQAPTPFTGTYSGMNPYDASYFQQVQQNYNRLFPTAPADVANPLQSWYQTQYKPDTTISNKLFGV